MLQKTKIFIMRKALLEDINQWSLDELIDYISNHFLCENKKLVDVEELNFDCAEKPVDILDELEYTSIETLQDMAKDIMRKVFATYTFEDYQNDYDYIKAAREL